MIQNNKIWLYALVFLVGLSNSYAYLNNLLSLALGDYIRVLVFILVITITIFNLLKIISKNYSIQGLPIVILGLIMLVIINQLLTFMNIGVSLNNLFNAGQIIINLLLIFNLYVLNIKYKHITSMIKIFLIGLLPSFLIPIIFYPEMIGVRMSFFEENNIMGAFWNFSVIAYFSIFWLIIYISTMEIKAKSRVILVSLSSLFIIGGLIGLSRSFLLMLLLSIFLYVLLQKNVWDLMKLSLVIITLSFGLILTYQDFIRKIIDRGFSLQNFVGDSRFLIYSSYIKEFNHYLLFGYIGENYRELVSLGIGTHSLLLNYLVQYGILSLILILYIFFVILKDLKYLNFPPALTVSFISYLGYTVFNETGFSEMQLYLYIGLLIKIILIEKDKLLNE